MYYQDADEFVEDDESDTDEENTEGAKPGESVIDETSTVDEATSSTAETAVERAEPVKKQTYSELRAELLAKFVDRGLIAIDLAAAQQQERASK